MSFYSCSYVNCEEPNRERRERASSDSEVIHKLITQMEN